MKIERIELYNFGSYEELNTFDIETDDASKRIVIIGGKNGAGKRNGAKGRNRGRNNHR